MVAIEKKNSERIQNIEGQLLQLDEANPEIIKAEESTLKGLEAEAVLLNKNFQKQQKIEIELQKLKKLFEKTAAQKSELEKLESKEQSYQKLESKINEYEYCLLNFKDLLARRREEITRVEISKRELESQREQLHLIKSNLESEEKSFQKLKQEFDNREILKQKSEELQKIARVKTLEKSVKQLREQINENDSAFQSSNSSIKELQEEHKKLAFTLKEKKQSMPDFNVLTAVSGWFTNRRQILTTLDKLKGKGERIAAELKQLESKKNQVISKELIPLITGEVETKSIKDITSDLKQGKIEIEKQKKKVEQEIEHLLVQEKLDELAENLVDGEPCPLCGSKEHPDVLSVENINQKLKITRQNQSEFKERINTINETLQNLKIISTQLKTQKDLLNANQKELDIENEKLKEHQIKFIWSDYSPDEDDLVKEAFEHANQLRQEIAEKEEELEQLQNKSESEIKHRDKIKDELDGIKDEKTKLDSEIQTLLGQLKHLNFADYSETSNEEMISKVQELTNKVAQIEKQYRELEEKVIQLRKEKDTLLGTIEAGEKTFKDYQQSLKEIEQKLNDKIDKSKYSNIGEIESVLEEELEVGKQKKAVSQFKQELHTVRVKYDELFQQTKDKSYDEVEHEQLLQELENLKNNLEQMKEDVVKRKLIIQRLKEALTKKEKLEKELADLKLRGEDINTLKQLFKGAGFVNYVSTVYLRNLCHAANERFYQLTRKQLRLEISESNNFEVRDFLNEGKVRSVKTLSGGQTFQASLSLALALAESIQKFHQSNQNFFFLDEGFGSLDKEALQVVFDTLKSLQKENRIVGIISHVEDLQQEIDTYLKITNDEEQGSIIQCSWESFN
ncbi:nuclease SbcCD subunit C [bacterium BMS3Abin03]|nr:nuclease SbcCD subunit C [bacterium BMS3Abin03]